MIVYVETNFVLELACFLTKNAKDFSNPNIVAALNEFDCRILFKFADGLAHVRARRKADSGP